MYTKRCVAAVKDGSDKLLLERSTFEDRFCGNEFCNRPRGTTLRTTANQGSIRICYHLPDHHT